MYLLLVNPKSGNNYYARIERALKARLARDKVRHKIILIEDLADIPQILNDNVRDSTRGVVAVGGNGTVASVIDALVGYDLPFAIIPASRTNHLAHMLGVRNWQTGLGRLTAHTLQDKCLGKIGERYFVGRLTIAPKRNLLTGVLEQPNWLKRFLGPNFARGLKKLQGVAATIKLGNSLTVSCQTSGLELALVDDGQKQIKLTIHTPHGKGLEKSIFHATTVSIASSLNMPILSGNETIANTPAKIQVIGQTIQFMGPPHASTSSKKAL